MPYTFHGYTIAYIAMYIHTYVYIERIVVTCYIKRQRLFIEEILTEAQITNARET